MENTTGEKSRPLIFNYRNVRVYFQDMLVWQKAKDPRFSLRQRTKGLRKCSPALVSQVLAGKRRLTPEKVDAFAKLFFLSAEEKSYLNQWATLGERTRTKNQETPFVKRKKRIGQNHILSDWVNFYVKDSSRLKGFKPDPKVVHQLLGGIASPKQVERSLGFLFREGFLKKTLDGKVVENEILVTTSDEKMDSRLQKFHRKSLDIAKRGVKLYPIEKRQASAVVLPLNKASFLELKQLVKEFYEKVLEFAENHPHDDEQLFQVTLHLTPIGGNAC